MLMVFGDESADEQEQLVFAVVGLIGTQEEWDDLTVVWKQRTGGTPFHASDCEAEPGRGQYKDMPREDRDKLYADMIKISLFCKSSG